MTMEALADNELMRGTSLQGRLLHTSHPKLGPPPLCSPAVLSSPAASPLKSDSVLAVSEWGSFMGQRRTSFLHHCRLMENQLARSFNGFEATDLMSPVRDTLRSPQRAPLR